MIAPLHCRPKGWIPDARFIGLAIGALATFLSIAQQGFADDATTAWRKILRKCAASDVIGKQSLFFGVSNSVGPGSVWRFADDKSIRLLFELSDAFPDEGQRTLLIKSNPVAQCAGDATSSWNLKLSLPFSTGAIPLAADIGAILGRAKKVTVSVSGFGVDELKEVNWKQAFQGLPPNNAYRSEVNQLDRVIAENVVKIAGLKAVFVFGSQLSADVQARFQGKSFRLGDSGGASGSHPAAGANAKQDATKQSATNAKNVEPKKSATNGPETKAAGGCAPGGAGGAASASSTVSGNLGSGAAELRAEVSHNNEISLCADGPFYLLAAYSKLVGGEPSGITSTQSAPMALVPVNIPASVAVKSERK